MAQVEIQDFDQEERAAWLRLSRTSRVGPVTFYKLLHRYGSPSQALAAIPQLSARGRGGALSAPSFEDVDAERRKLGQLGGCFVFACDPRYPELLRHTHDAPPVLSCLGDPALLNQQSLGVVGSRNASTNGIRLTSNLCAELGERGLIIASGLARGIDAAAHKASLPTGTIGVVAGGVDVIYPRENEALYQQMRQGKAAILSETALGVQPIASSFPKRNRIIAGISLGTLVIEANRRSGSLITARLANELGREVMAIPGSPLDARASGTNHLLRQGATLVTCADDVIEALRSPGDLLAMDHSEHASPQSSKPNFDDAEIAELRDELLHLLSPAPTPLDDLVRQSGAPAEWVQAALVELELLGEVERDLGNVIVRI